MWLGAVQAIVRLFRRDRAAAGRHPDPSVTAHGRVSSGCAAGHSRCRGRHEFCANDASRWGVLQLAKVPLEEQQLPTATGAGLGT